MKKIIKNKKFKLLRIISKIIAVGGGLTAGFAISNVFGLIIGGIIGFFIENIIFKTYQYSLLKKQKIKFSYDNEEEEK